ncbi:hypothetical protein ALI144C_34290 [Actinosynnema sp. ALI-1.44]|uniref:hypothetical protein n=1 Tax=Actinosynnema sp. ALI-1.44 TaxID=1933779 RepID=UPI00097BFCFD|nr:hypothetical protein [Actinosynnema sp. ALI-1.44]ONI77157.1 hypothetical protein ALI144C_34290 [Actinosynnema sp. ALI-1.44]
MAEAITDQHVAVVLRVFVRRCDPMVHRLRDDGEPVEVDETDPDVDRSIVDKVKSVVASIKRPGMKGWGQLPIDERVDWWISRVGRFTSLLASVTGLAGVWGDRLPLQDMLGSASQGLLLCAIASERGVDDIGVKVRLLASILFDRDIDMQTARGKGDAAADEEMVAKLTEDQDGPPVEEVEEPVKGRKFGVKAGFKWLWRQARILFSITGELEKRPQGRFYHKAVGMLPVVGMAGDYLGERSALKRAAKRGSKWLTQQGIQ